MGNLFDEIRGTPIGKSWLEFAAHEGFMALKPEFLTTAEDVLFPEPRCTGLSDPGELAALKFAQISVMLDYAYSTWLSLVEAFKTCESPIERYFLSAIIVLKADHSEELVIHTKKDTLDTSQPWTSKFHIYPQHTIGEYRVDFLLTHEYADYPKDEKGEKQFNKDPYFRPYSLVVECDGHDYHEKTKEQASRDKERDRTLQACGYPVFRFSGSDLHRDALRCAYDCTKFLDEKVYGKLDDNSQSGLNENGEQ